MPETLGDRAVVLGGSMAGLLAARVLADAYAEVVVVERDELPPPQRTVAGCRSRGTSTRCSLEASRPWRSSSTVSPPSWSVSGRRLATCSRTSGPTSGVTDCNPARQACWHCRPAGRCSRRACAHECVRCRPWRSWTGAMSPDSPPPPMAAESPARGWSDRLDGSAEQTLTADLVVDATGRGSRTPAWLEIHGYPSPPVERVRIGLGYASRTYRLVPGLLDGRPGNPQRGDTRASARRGPRGDGERSLPGHPVRNPR